MITRSISPLRIGLAGGGTDIKSYYEKYQGSVLNATINLFTHCTIESNLNKELKFISLDIKKEFICTETNKVNLEGDLLLHKAVYNRIVKAYNSNRPLNITITTYSDSPPGSGLGSSSSLVVCMIKSYTEFLNIRLDEYEISHLAYTIERIDLGFSGGKQDQYAAAFGGFNFMEFYKNGSVLVNQLRINKWIINELEESIILYNTGESRVSSKIIDEQIKNTNQKHEIAINAMHKVRDSAISMKETLLKGDLNNFGKIIDESWKNKQRMSSRITSAHIENLFDIALEAGAISGKVSGAGGGGFIMFFVDPLRKIEVINALSKQKGNIFNAKFYKYGCISWKLKTINK